MRILLLIIYLVPIAEAHADRARRLAIALALAAEQPAEQSIAHHRPGCTWLSPKSVSGTSKKPLPTSADTYLESGVSKPPSPAGDADATDVSPIGAKESDPPQVTWTTWAKAEKTSRPKLYYFSTRSCFHCPAMLKNFEDRQVVEALQGMEVVKMPEYAVQMWHIKAVPFVVLADGKNKIRERIEGLVPAAELAVEIRKFKSDLDADRGSYYPPRRVNWTLNNRWVNGDHLLNHHMHSWRKYDPAYVRSLDFNEVNYLHSADHDNQIDWHYARQKP